MSEYCHCAGMANRCGVGSFHCNNTGSACWFRALKSRPVYVRRLLFPATTTGGLEPGGQLTEVTFFEKESQHVFFD